MNESGQIVVSDELSLRIILHSNFHTQLINYFSNFDSHFIHIGSVYQ